MTAFRVTPPPSAAAIWLALRPSPHSFANNSTRSSVQPVAASFIHSSSRARFDPNPSPAADEEIVLRATASSHGEELVGPQGARPMGRNLPDALTRAQESAGGAAAYPQPMSRRCGALPTAPAQTRLSARPGLTDGPREAGTRIRALGGLRHPVLGP